MDTTLEAQPYNPRAVPPRGSDSRSRFALSTSPKGIKVSTGMGMTLAFQTLLADRAEQLEPLEDPTKTVTLQKMTASRDGTITLTPCKPLHVRPTHRAVKNHGRFSSTGGTSAGSLLDLLFLGELAEANEAQLWTAAKHAAEAEKLHGHELLQFNRVVANLILTRAGCPGVSPLELPL